MKGNGKPHPIPQNRIAITALGDKMPGVVVECELLRGYTKVEFSIHALEQMKIRGLTRDEVLKTIREPQKTGLPTQPKRQRFRRYRRENRATDVVFEEWDDRIIVVTAMIVSLRKKDRPS